MTKTLVVNLHSGPGCGKSTTAAQIFAALKLHGVNAELVTEYAKGWAWQDRKIKPLDQFYLFGKQLHREYQLYDKVDVIVSDSPTAIAAYYAHRYCSTTVAHAIATSWAAVRHEACADYLDIVLERTKAYNPKGRYETEEQARQIDVDMKAFLKDRLGVDYHLRGTTDIQPILDLLPFPHLTAPRTKSAILKAAKQCLKLLRDAIDVRVADYGDVWEGEGEAPDVTPNGGSYDEFATDLWRQMREVEEILEG